MKSQRSRASAGRRGFAVAVVAVLGIPSFAPAADLVAVVTAGESRDQVAQASQKKVDAVVEETRDLEQQYKQVLKELDGLEVYNRYMDRQIENQAAELAEIRASIDQVSSIERQIMPLMIRMLEGLENFVALDVPFLLEERRHRVAGLRALMERADVTVAEKFRSLTEAFQIENDFGRTIETYKETLEIAGATLEVDILRIGRIGLYYQSGDASRTGMWDVASASWKELSGGESRNQVRQGLRIARKQVAPDLLVLPVPPAEASS